MKKEYDEILNDFFEAMKDLGVRRNDEGREKRSRWIFFSSL